MSDDYRVLTYLLHAATLLWWVWWVDIGWEEVPDDGPEEPFTEV